MLNKQDLAALLSVGAGYRIEFKERFSRNISREACAFANSAGGSILIGVNAAGEIVGADLSNKNIASIEKTLHSIKPVLKYSLRKLNNIIVVKIFEGKDKPYSSRQGFFIRQGTISQKLDRNQIIDFCKKEELIGFAELVNESASFSRDFSLDAWRRFVALSGISSSVQRKDLLRNLSCLVSGNQLSNAGVLMFAKNIDFILNHGIVTCVLYQGNDKVKVLDKKDLKHDLIRNIDEALVFVKNILNSNI